MKKISLSDVNLILKHLREMAFDGFDLELASKIIDVQDVLNDEDNINTLNDCYLNSVILTD